jgi:hypothetical protein
LEEATMNTATIHHHRLFLPAINMFVAVAAVVIAVFALADDPAKVTEVITQQPGAAVSQDPVEATMTPLLAGCDLGFSRC